MAKRWLTLLRTVQTIWVTGAFDAAVLSRFLFISNNRCVGGNLNVFYLSDVRTSITYIVYLVLPSSSSAINLRLLNPEVNNFWILARNWLCCIAVYVVIICVKLVTLLFSIRASMDAWARQKCNTCWIIVSVLNSLTVTFIVKATCIWFCNMRHWIVWTWASLIGKLLRVPDDNCSLSTACWC